ncbi:hypothetical protein [Rothia mucilaginosa]|uniref:hypothetical protein n=1 Tax=Rothia mucilaginosa TaxID=43675 RepID=UPI0026ED4440|nr:hypothetical protein [Rothia mucilaginosa]
MTLNWFPLPKNTGSISARGAPRTLGRPNLSPLALVTREMAQNSWDARLEGRMPEFGCLVRYANQGVLNTLRNDVFAAGFEIHSKYTGLDQTFNRGDVYFLEFWDRGTVGLDGPDRPDEAVEEGESQNFVNLTMNLGSDNKGQGNGGSYGFGKTAAFNMSESQSVIYWSAFKTKTGEIDYRLIAVALGKEYTYDGRNYTGRHWWGYEGPTVKGTGNILPLTGERARLLGKEIFSRHFNDGETGTSILIVDAKPAELMEVSDDEGKIPDEPDQIIDRSHEKIQNIVMYHLWPKLDVEDGNRSMDIRINNNPVLIQNLKNKPEYKGIEQLCSALIDVRKMSEHKNIDFESFDGVFRYKGYIFKRTRDSYNIGYLKIVLGAYDSTAERSIYPQNTVCLMRNEAELVVQYRKVNDLDDSKATWYGVFKPDLETDVAFREAEPPAHDEWNPSSLENAKHKNIVVYAASNITKSLKSLFESKDTKRDSGSLGSWTKISQKLARFNPIMSSGGVVVTELTDEDEGKNKKRPGGVVRRASVSIESAAMTGVHPQNPDYVQYFISFSCSSAWKAGQRVGIKVSIATGDERTLEYTDSHDLEPSWSEGWGPDTNDTQKAGHVYVQWDGPEDSEENQGAVVITLRKGKTYIFEVEG